jgi:hypothetical protein
MVRSPKRVFLSGLAVCFGLGLGWLLLEAGLRLGPTVLPLETHSQLSQKRGLAPLGQPRFIAEYGAIWEADDYLRERMKAGVETVIHGNPEYPAWPVRTSSLGLGAAGFRDSRPARPAYALVLGDSFGFGVGVTQPEIWSERLEREIGQPVVNLSQVGASSLQEARIYARYGRHFPAKVVFWLFFQNDLKDNLRFAQWLDPASPIPQAARQVGTPCSGLGHRLLKRYSLAYELWLFWQQSCEYGSMTPTPTYHDKALSLRFCLDHDICDEQVQTVMLESGWPLTRQAVLETARVVAETGATLVVVIVPAKEQVYDTQFRQAAGLPLGYDPDRLVEPMRQLCRQENLRCLDLTGPFRADVKAGSQRYFSIDIHWNAAGHALVAEVVGVYLAQEQLLP